MSDCRSRRSIVLNEIVPIFNFAQHSDAHTDSLNSTTLDLSSWVMEINLNLSFHEFTIWPLQPQELPQERVRSVGGGGSGTPVRWKIPSCLSCNMFSNEIDRIAQVTIRYLPRWFHRATIRSTRERSAANLDLCSHSHVEYRHSARCSVPERAIKVATEFSHRLYLSPLFTWREQIDRGFSAGH